MEESVAQNIYSMKSLIKCDIMRKKTIIILLILTLAIFALNINVQLTAEENDYRPPSLELTPHNPIEITSDSDFEVFPGTGTEEAPYIIDGYNITSTSQNGIYINGTTKYFIVRNCYIDAVKYGIYIFNVADGTATVINNTCSDNVEGILLHKSGGSIVVNNTCRNNYYGLCLWFSGSSTVANNTCNSNYHYGIMLSFSGSSTIANNTCSNNINWGGIVFEESGSSTVANNTCSNNRGGFYLSGSGSSTIINNICINNSDDGIYLAFSAFCVITYNLLQDNEKYGVYLRSDSDNCLFHHNAFVDNNLGGTSQACDNGTNNFWYDSSINEGNFWSDWSGRGSYSIDGSASSEDLYPLDELAEYSVESQLNFTFTLLMLVVPLILTRIISKKTKKE